ncbi:MAG: phytoene desaturase family protein [Spirochaetia bacterium]|nr:phytoene desaturase family protein [Spirochaetia bacterium]
MPKTAIVVGAGFAGLSTAALLAKQGMQVTVLEKNETIGGRARLWNHGGFTFDMGPSWYLMPEVFERFFGHFDRRVSDYYHLSELDPYYRVFFNPGEFADITPNYQNTKRVFDYFEPGGGEQLDTYMELARYKYKVAMEQFLYREYSSIFQFFNGKMMREGLKLNVLDQMDHFVSRYFKDRRSKQLLEYAMVFLGTSPQKAPALYSIMSHVDIDLGVHYPMGGLGAVAKGFASLAREQGVDIRTNADVTSIRSKNRQIEGVMLGDEYLTADTVVYTGDYPYAEMELLDASSRSFGSRYWRSRTLSPSMFLMYIGLDRKLSNFKHHTLYFEEDWTRHFKTIFDSPEWPLDPCFYVSVISKTDPQAAPKGSENVFVLVPVAPGLDDSDEKREEYAEHVLDHITRITGEDLRVQQNVQRIFSHRDFKADYHAYQGTALSMAHTLFQTAVFRPPHHSKKVKGLYYTGHYTHPGVGVPMTLISSEIVAGEIKKSRQ